MGKFNVDRIYLFFLFLMWNFNDKIFIENDWKKKKEKVYMYVNFLYCKKDLFWVLFVIKFI